MSVELVWSGKDSAKAAALYVPPLFWHESAQGSKGCSFSDTLNAPQKNAEFSENAHHVCIGDNLDVLRSVRQASIRFHFVYIDPPYNSGQNFTFKDVALKTQSDADPQSAWLSLMYPRLVLARDVMRDDGVLFVSIDDRELASLTLILCEIFGKENHVATLKWRKKRKPSFLDKHLSSVMEYILVFAKDKNKLVRFVGEKSEESTRPVLNASNGLGERILRRDTQALCKDGLYAKGIYKNRTLEIELLADATVEGGKLVSDVPVRGRFRVSQAVLDATVYVTPQFGLRRRVLDSERSHKHVSDHSPDWPTNEDAELELRTIFGKRVFDFPKPVGLLKSLLKMCSVPSTEPYHCLDFFAGSATLAEAVLAQNSIDGKPRRFFCVQSPDLLKEAVVEQNLHTISDISVARARYAIEKYSETLPLVVLEAYRQDDDLQH